MFILYFDFSWFMVPSPLPPFSLRLQSDALRSLKSSLAALQGTESPALASLKVQLAAAQAAESTHLASLEGQFQAILDGGGGGGGSGEASPLATLQAEYGAAKEAAFGTLPPGAPTGPGATMTKAAIKATTKDYAALGRLKQQIEEQERRDALDKAARLTRADQAAAASHERLAASERRVAAQQAVDKHEVAELSRLVEAQGQLDDRVAKHLEALGIAEAREDWQACAAIEAHLGQMPKTLEVRSRTKSSGIVIESVGLLTLWLLVCVPQEVHAMKHREWVEEAQQKQLILEQRRAEQQERRLDAEQQQAELERKEMPSSPPPPPASQGTWLLARRPTPAQYLATLQAAAKR